MKSSPRVKSIIAFVITTIVAAIPIANHLAREASADTIPLSAEIHRATSGGPLLNSLLGDYTSFKLHRATPGRRYASAVGRTDLSTLSETSINYSGPGMLKADYRFQGNLNSSVAGAPAMGNLGTGNSFATDMVDGSSRQTVRFPFNNGLSVSTTGLIPNNTYTIVILFKFDQVSGYRRVIDFANRTSDAGVYILDGRLEGESLANPPFGPNTYVQIVASLDASGVVRGYRDGIQRGASPHDGELQISPANLLRFFQDDVEFPNEASAGNVARIRLYDGALTTAQVQALDRLPPGPTPTPTPTPTATPTPTPTATPTPTPTPTPTATPTPTPTATPTPTPPACNPIAIAFGQSFNGTLNANSCVLNSFRTDLYIFNGTAGQRVAATMVSTQLDSVLEIVTPTGGIIAGNGAPGVTVRTPVSGFVTLPVTGAYTLRAADQLLPSTGEYTVSLFQQQATACTYSLSPARTDVPSTGGTFSFDVLTQPGCPPEAAPVAPAGAIYSIVSYVNGRVTFSVQANPEVARAATITVAGQTHTINQFGAAAPGNDLIANAQVLTGTGTVPGVPILGANTNATAEAGEPAHAGNTAAKSVWYSFTPPAGASGLYSFSTSGSSFDTVTAIYACPAAGGCTFANFTLVGSNDDVTAFDATSKVNFRAEAGTRYVIAVDGKNGATGTVALSFMQYERLYRLYLQTYNGTPVTLVPETVRASNGTTTRNATRISLGVYEFNLPADNTTYIVTISGPTGIVWDPNNFPLDTSFRSFDELMNRLAGGSGGGQNSTSNAQCLDGCDVIGYVRNITADDLTQGRIKVRLGFSRASTPARRDEEDCTLSFQSDLGVPHVRYQCIARPQSTHDIVPAMAGKRFVEAIYSFSNPIGVIIEDIRTPRFIASDAATFSISGRVLAGGDGTAVDLAYTPIGASPIVLRTRTGANGVYEFLNLAPGIYQPTATREGFIFNTPAPVNLQTANATGVDISSAGACTYGVTNPPEFAAAGGAGNLTVSTAFTCEWEAASEVSWVQVNSGVGPGNGNVLLTILPNVGPARTGMVRLRNRSERVVISQASGCAFNLSQPTQVNFPASGGTGSVNVTATAAECGYAPTATDYCMITSLTAGGAGNGVVNFTVSANAGVARSTTIAIGGRTFVLNQAAAAGTHRTRFDFDGDGRADLAVFRPSNGFWYLQRVGSMAFDNLPFGLPEDIPTAADYDGDGRTDIAVFRASNQFWYRTNSGNGNFEAEQFGAVGDIPVPADYDGDGRDNIAVFRPSIGTWYTSTNPAINYGAVVFGAAGDIPRPADYDGDGKSDIAVYRPSNGVWYGIRSSNQQMFAVAFGTTGDMPVPADYDGDGRAELAVFRPSEGIWYRMNLTTGAFAATQWGQPGDLPVPADYNGDKFADLAVYRPSNGIWYVWSCTNNPLSNAQQFGLSTDRVIPFTNSP